MVEAIIFDFDGVLVKSNEIRRKAYFDIFPESPEKDIIVEEVLKNSKTKTRWELIEDILLKLKEKKILDYGDLDEEKEKYVKKYSKITEDEVSKADEIGGAGQCLKQLSKKCPLFVISGTTQESLDIVIENRKLNSYFKKIYGTMPGKRSKIDMIKKLLEEFDLNSRKIIYVGDGEEDFEVANFFGMIFVGVINETNDFENRGDIRWKLNNLERLPEIVGGGEEEQLRKEILERVGEIYNLRKENEKFIPGVSRVNYAGRVYDEKEMQALIDASLDFWLTLGKKGKEFEKKFSEYLGLKKVIVCNSGSSANLLAISSLCSPMMENPLREGDEIITVASTFPTTLAPIIQNNLIPVFVDVELGTYNIDASKIEDAISSKTRGIFFAHTLGNPAEIDKIMDIARKHKLYVIEDTCDALDSRYDGKIVGTFGDISTYSFYAPHHMTMGEGGALATNNPDIARAATSIRDWGRDCFCQTGEKNPNGACNDRFGHKFKNLPYGYDHKYVFSNIGYNLKPLDIQCAIGLKQLEKLPEFTKKRKENFKKLYETFSKYQDKIILPKWSPKSNPSWFAFPITIKENAGFTRKEIVKFLEGKNIETRMLFGGNILRQPGFENIKKRVAGDLKNADVILTNTFFLGVYPGLTGEKIKYVIDCVNEFFRKY